MRRHNRSTTASVGLATVLVMLGCSCSEGSRDTGTTTVSYVAVREQGTAGYAAALVQGYFAREGLTFSPTWATSGSVILQGLVGGSFDVADLGPAQLYEAIKNGACARVLRPTEGAAYGLISQPRLHLEATLAYPQVLKQLKGTTIGIPARGATQELVVRTLLRDAGLNPDTDVSWVAIGVGAPAVAAFAADKVDVAMSYSQLEVNLQANGTEFDKLLDLTGLDTPLGSFWQAVAVANCGWADTHHETVMKFCHTLNQGFVALANDPAVGPKAFAYLKIGSDLDQAKILWARYKAPVIQIPALNQTNWTYQARFTPSDYTPDFSKYVVNGCAAA
jgi:NitT/TauT family transport system substrate-binding protein